ncbi:hypothetical protein Amet_4381 [Alkaliphilus metalliredigens QYMF]|uniref:Uncharacterized protein n=1 Tax=Alkaliphilus metalliredigens (strain QYMF) TaxID=293826 RepID=A6TKB1_ALKMQ|nr:hypothetical protein [Alkaliphilus metalliredigens]ABR46629.1 hypothetical protein Amet_0401 [Alkaliphilus metalliredigens QYMF]ABR48102.1 hypothetical protein Amet_1939 [Alkaliphilus metalliredigens QYMF]ABR50455.1 hypothetical protein Amet_4381 [Alkaliphilus metalliredigens QYMF]
MYELKCNKCNNEWKTHTISETTRFLCVCSKCGSTDVEPFIKMKCIKGFSLEMSDDNGFTIENEYTAIEEGTIWNIQKDSFRVVGGEIRLTNDELGWLELSQETLEENFETVS